MPKVATKKSNTDTKVKKSDFKLYQIRINITRELYNEIQKAKASEYKFLDDAEIIKIFLSRGAKKTMTEYDDSDISNEDLTKHNLMMFLKDEDLENEPAMFDPSNLKPINWNN